MWLTAECWSDEAKGGPNNVPVIRRQKQTVDAPGRQATGGKRVMKESVASALRVEQSQPRSGHLLAHATGQSLSSKLAHGAHEQLADETGSGTALGGRACRPTLGLGGREL
ncbi:hypothetical protein MHYP_G00273700 [Metynnis hypsauchen]